jgi:uncharacterized membrane protein YraQ (UPF0718 family)
MRERTKLFLLLAVFLVFYFLPVTAEWHQNLTLAGFALLNEYAQEHVLTCLVPAFFIAGAIAVFLKKEFVLKYLSGRADKAVSYGIASISGAILAVCSCTILPLFAGIYRRGAGLGPAITLLFSGPAINVAAVFLTMSVLGYQIGIARLIGAVFIAILTGLCMSSIFKEERGDETLLALREPKAELSRPVMTLFFGLMLGVLVVNGFQMDIALKWSAIAILVLGVALLTSTKFTPTQRQEWLGETWSFTKMLLPYLFAGVFIAGVIQPLLPQEVIKSFVGSNTLYGNLAASVFGAFMYFSTLTEVPILQALMAKGMSAGPALALLLAGPSLSLPNMLVIRRVLGTKKTLAYIALVIIFSTIAGFVFGSLVS